MEKKKVGLVVMAHIDVGGGYPHVINDLINSLNKSGKKVYLLAPFEPNLDKIKDLFGETKLDRVYTPSGIRKLFSLDDNLRRWLLKKEFKKMAKDVDFIIDIDGRIMDKYIPENFDKNNYVIWSISGTAVKRWKIDELLSSKNLRNILRFFAGSFFNLFTKIPDKKTRIYPFDKWTRKKFKGFDVKLMEELYAPVHTKSLVYEGPKPLKQIIVLGRIDPWKNVDDAVKIFAEATKNKKDYNLVIIGGTTPNSPGYIEKLESMIKKYDMEKRVQIIKDPSFGKIKEEVKKSRIIIEPMHPVNITMTAIEAMAAGGIVLANKESGTYMEVLEKGKYGYGYSNISEGTKKLREIIDKLEKKKINNKASIKRSQDFSLERFQEHIKTIIDG